MLEFGDPRKAPKSESKSDLSVTKYERTGKIYSLGQDSWIREERLDGSLYRDSYTGYEVLGNNANGTHIVGDRQIGISILYDQKGVPIIFRHIYESRILQSQNLLEQMPEAEAHIFLARRPIKEWEFRIELDGEVPYCRFLEYKHEGVLASTKPDLSRVENKERYERMKRERKEIDTLREKCAKDIMSGAITLDKWRDLMKSFDEREAVIGEYTWEGGQRGRISKYDYVLNERGTLGSETQMTLEFVGNVWHALESHPDQKLLVFFKQLIGAN